MAVVQPIFCRYKEEPLPSSCLLFKACWTDAVLLMYYFGIIGDIHMYNLLDLLFVIRLDGVELDVGEEDGCYRTKMVFHGQLVDNVARRVPDLQSLEL